MVIAETGFILVKRGSIKSMFLSDDEKITVMPNKPPAGRLPLPTKGTNLLNSPLGKFAYQIAPGDIAPETQMKLSGFTIDKTTQADGSIMVKLTPKDSEDQNQQYIIKTGEKLYFIEQTTIDDQPNQNTDKNLRDDYGVIVDSQGNIQ